MKQFLIFIFAAFMATNAIAAIEPQNRSTNLKVDGSIDAATLEKEYINVVNKSGAALVAGNIVVWDVSNDDGASVTTSSTAYAIPACMVTEACAENALCKKCQVYGYTSQLLFADESGGSASAGKCAYISEDTKGYVQATADGSVDAKDQCIAMFYDAASATGAVEAFLKLK